MSKNPRADWKAVQLDFDYVQSLDGEETCPYRFTDQEVSALITIIEPIGWKTRWYSKFDSEIDVDWIEALRDRITQELNTPTDDCDPTPPIEECCEELAPNSSFIRYAPNNPFLTPDYTPPQYLLPPWYTNPGVPLPGVIPSDAMVNFLAMPAWFGLPTVGFPRFRFYGQGSGQVEIEFVQIVQGGLVLVVPDGNPFDAEFIDLTSIGLTEVASIGFILGLAGIDNDASTYDTHIWEHDFDTPGLHYVDAYFFPNISLTDEILIGMGGGIRKVTLCGLTPVEIDDGEEEMASIFRMNEACILQFSNDAGVTWIDVEGWATYAFDCLAGEDGTDGTDGIDGSSPEMRTFEDTVQWKLEDETVWKNLFVIPSGGGGEGSSMAYQNCRLATAFTRQMLKFVSSWVQFVSLNKENGASQSTTLIHIRNQYPYDMSEEVDTAFTDWVAYLYLAEDTAPGFMASLVNQLGLDETRQNLATKLKCSMSAEMSICPDDIEQWILRQQNWYSGNPWYIGWSLLADALAVYQFSDMLKLGTDQFWQECDVVCSDDENACDLEPPPIVLEWSEDFDFTVQANCWFPTTSETIYSAGIGFRPEWYGGGGGVLQPGCIRIRSTVIAPTKLTRLEVHLNEPIYPDVRMIVELRGAESGDIEWTETINLTSGDSVLEFSPAPDIDYDRINIATEEYSVGCSFIANGIPVITRVIAEGTGDNPFTETCL